MTNKLKALIEEEIKKKGYSRRTLALRMKLPPQSINNYLDSATAPTVKSLQKIADYFHKPVSFFIDNEKYDNSRGSPPPTESPHKRRSNDDVELYCDQVRAIFASGDGAAIASVIADLAGALATLHQGVQTKTVLELKDEVETVKKELEEIKNVLELRRQGAVQSA